MKAWEAAVIGIVEGVTEYLPVSSTGHNVLAQRLLGIPDNEAAKAYAICVQAGAILAVAVLYWSRLVEIVASCWGEVTRTQNRSTAGFQLAVQLVVAFLPAAVVGILFDDWIEARLFGLEPIVAAWFVGGALILAVSAWRRQSAGAMGTTDITQGDPLTRLTWRGALAIGCIQCLAMWPGTSRSLVTIVGGLLVGLQLSAAVEFSFLLGMITLLAATLFKAKDAGPVMLHEYGWPTMIVGGVAAWISAVISVKWMVHYLQRHGLSIFGWYRIVLALVVGGLIWSGQL